MNEKEIEDLSEKWGDIVDKHPMANGVERNDLQQVFIVNSDLKMGKGKIAVQVAHGEVFYISHVASASMEKQIFGDIQDEIDETNMIIRYFDWVKDGIMKKIVLKATQEKMELITEQLEFIEKVWFNKVYDKGFTQVPENSFTCIVIEPLSKELCDHMFKNLKLL